MFARRNNVLNNGAPVTPNIALSNGLTRFVGPSRNFGPTLTRSWALPLNIVDLCLLPQTGLLFLVEKHNYVLLYSFEDELVLIYAGTGEEGAKNGHRLHATFHAPHGLCYVHSLPSVLVCDFHNSLIRRITASNLVETFSGGGIPGKDGPAKDAGFLHPISIAALSDGTFLVSEASPNLRLVGQDGHVKTIKVGLFMDEPIAYAGCLVTARLSGRPMICSRRGLFDVLTHGSATLIVSSTVLGFAPLAALEVKPSLFVASDGEYYYLVDTSCLLHSDVTVEKLFEAKNGLDGWTPSCTLTRDPSTSTVYIPVPGPDSTLIQQLSWEQACKERDPTSSEIGAALSSVVLDSTADSTLKIDSNENSMDHPFSIKTYTLIRSAASSHSPFSTSCFMEVSPTGHIFISKLHGLLIFDELEGFSKNFAGAENEAGLCDGSLLDARFDTLGSICFVSTEGEDWSHFDEDTAVMRPSATLKHCFGPNMTLLVADTGNHRIRRISPYGMVVTLIGRDEGHQDGPTSEAKFTRPVHVRPGYNGDLFISESSKYHIRYVNRDNFVLTLATNLELIAHPSPSLDGLSSDIQSLLVMKTLNREELALLVAIQGIIFRCTVTTAQLSARVPMHLSTPENCLIMEKWSGYAGVHRDAWIGEAGFGEEIRLAATLDPALCPYGDDVYVLDCSLGSIRRIRNSRVETLLPGAMIRTGHQQHRERPIAEGLHRRARFPGPVTIACTSTGTIVTQNVDGVVMRTDHVRRAPGGSTSFGLGYLLDRSYTLPSSDNGYFIDLFDKKWHLHRGVLELHAPGLLLSHVIEALRASTHVFFESDFWNLIHAIYCDTKWDEIWFPDRNCEGALWLEKRVSLLLRILELASLIGNERYLESVKHQLVYCFRYSVHCRMSIAARSIDSISPPSIGDMSHVSAYILEQLSTLKDSSLRMLILELFLPYLATTVRLHNLPPQLWHVALSASPILLERVNLHLERNLVEICGSSLQQNHSGWCRRMRSLLTWTPIGMEIHREICISHSHDSSLNPDIHIEGERTRWFCHKWVLSKSSFFNALFGSSFAESTSRVWKMSHSLGSGIELKDEVIGALLDYLYTNDAEVVDALSPVHRHALINALPFFFLEDAHTHISAIGY